MDSDGLRLFALSETHPLGKGVAAALDIPLAQHEERDFEDGEHKIRPLENLRNRDVFVIQSLYSDASRSVNDKLCRLLFFLTTLKDAGAARLTAVLPYLCYARKDRRTKDRDPVTSRYVAQLLEAAGIDRVVTLDVHNPAAFQNAFRCPSDHLEARTLFVDHFAPLLRHESLVVVSPDVGGAKRAEAFRRALSLRLQREVGNAFLEKYRSGGEISGAAVVGDMEDRIAIVIDDLVSTGGTLVRAARACREAGARRVYAAATHGIFVGAAQRYLDDPVLSGLVVSNTIPPFRLTRPARDKLQLLDTAPLLASAVRCIHAGESLTQVMSLE